MPEIPALLTSPYPIWQIAHDAADQWVLLETRSKEDKKNHVFFFQPNSNILHRVTLPVTEPWWFRLFGCYKGVAIFQQYPDPSLPVSQGIWAFDLAEQTLLWSAPHLQAQSLHKEGIWARDPNFSSLYTLQDLHTGLAKGKETLGPDMRYSHIHFPKAATPTKWIKEAGIPAQKSDQPMQDFMALTEGKVRIAHWTEPTPSRLEQHIAVWYEGGLYWRHTFELPAGKPQQDVCMLAGETLILLEGKQKIWTSRLPR